MDIPENIINKENRPLVWPALLGISLFLPWAKVIGIINTQILGFDIDTGPMILIAALVVAGSWLYEDGKYRKVGWLGGGSVAALLSVANLMNIQSRIADYQAQMEGNMFADAVSIRIGVGVYLAIIASAAILYQGYQIHTTEDAVSEPKAEAK